MTCRPRRTRQAPSSTRTSRAGATSSSTTRTGCGAPPRRATYSSSPRTMKGGLVTITDNADPMNVVVYRTAKKLKRGQKRTVCQVPVFDKGKSATENSEITAGRSIVVENNYGYQDPLPPSPYFANP